MKKLEKPSWDDGGGAPPTARLGDLEGVAWYDPASFAEWRREGILFAEGCERWEDWFPRYQITFRRVGEAGFKPVKVPVRAAVLAVWLDGREDTRQAREAFVLHCLDERAG